MVVSADIFMGGREYRKVSQDGGEEFGLAITVKGCDRHLVEEKKD